jgi:hypothetical protein
VRALPVVGKDGRLEGYVSIFSLGDYFIPKPKRATSMRKVTSSINAIIRSIGGTEVVAYDAASVEELYVRVAAMELDSFGKSATVEGIPTNQSVIVVGDRADVHLRAIEMGVRIIIVTGGHRMRPEVLERAKAAKVSVAYADTDSATTAWAVRASTLVGGLVQRDAFTFKPQEKLSVARRRMRPEPGPDLPRRRRGRPPARRLHQVRHHQPAARQARARRPQRALRRPSTAPPRSRSPRSSTTTASATRRRTSPSSSSTSPLGSTCIDRRGHLPHRRPEAHAAGRRPDDGRHHLRTRSSCRARPRRRSTPTCSSGWPADRRRRPRASSPT